MAQNVYDDPEFFAGYSRLRRQVEGLDGAPEWPRLRAMLPQVGGKRVADLGCGFGWASRFFVEEGAASVLGIDLSRNMLARAQQLTDAAAIEYRRADLDTLELPSEAFELVFSALAFHYVERWPRLARVAHAALAPGGDLVFTIEHPVFTAPASPGWTLSEHGLRSWLLEGYAAEGERRRAWLGGEVVKYHRSLGTTLNALIAAGFDLRHVEEFSPSPGQIEQRPELAEEAARPMILMVAARKPPLPAART